MKINLTYGLMILLLFSTCSKDDNFQAAPKAIDQQKLLDLVNQTRAKGCNCGGTNYPKVTPLVWNAMLEIAAKAQSNDMDANNFFDHKGSDGSMAGDRISRTGYKWSTYGENIAKGYASEESVITGWLESPGHCKNIMNGAFKEMAVSATGVYWTQVFASK